MMDAAPPYVTDYFPARNLFRTGNGGAGHWTVAQRSGQDQRFRAVVRSASSEQKMAGEVGEVMHQNRRRQSNKMESRAERVLDTSFLMRTQHVQKPSDLCAADVSDRGLTAAQWEEFQQFTCLAYINASENMLHLDLRYTYIKACGATSEPEEAKMKNNSNNEEPFCTFPALRELDLSMNGIHRITVVPGEFPHLEVLDLSYNSLSPGDIPQLGVLPRLRVLCLTGNRLTKLPPDLSAPPRKSADIHMFPSLEVFMLDENLLSHPSLFVSLAGLRRLRLLNLDKNAISAIPDLSGAVIRQTEPGGDMEGQGHMTQEAEMTTEGELEGSQTTEDSVHYMVLRSMTDPDRTEVIFPSPRNPSDRTMKPLNGDIRPSSPPGPPMSPTESLSPPLPNLRTLSLADNKIAREEDILPAALFPSLRELVIHGNPLTTLRKGRPPLLGSFLQDRLGIKVTHRKSPGLHKPHLIIPRKEKRKVATHVPKIPKQPLMLESLLSPFLRLPQPESDVTESVMSSSPLLPPIRTSTEKGADTPPGRSQVSAEASSEEEMSVSCDPDVEPVFMTQVDNIPDSPAGSLHILSPAPEERDKEETQPKRIPERFRGYEELYDVRADPGFIEPVGIQNNVRALEYTLRHLLVYGDLKPRLHGIQKMYIPRESKFGSGYLSDQKTREDLVAEVLRSMKDRQQVVEAPLDSAIREGRSRKEHKEAKLLLKEIQEKYKQFHEEAVKRASEVEADLRNTARQLLQAQRNGEGVHKRATNGGR